MENLIAHSAMLLIGANIRNIRSSKGYSQIDLAGICNMEKASMSRIESGKTNITLLTLFKIANALDVYPGDLFSGGQVLPMPVAPQN